jgi:hypothetical protein
MEPSINIPVDCILGKDPLSTYCTVSWVSYKVILEVAVKRKIPICPPGTGVYYMITDSVIHYTDSPNIKKLTCILAVLVTSEHICVLAEM